MQGRGDERDWTQEAFLSRLKGKSVEVRLLGEDENVQGTLVGWDKDYLFAQSDASGDIMIAKTAITTVRKLNDNLAAS